MQASAALAKYDNPYESGLSPSFAAPTARYAFLRAATARQTLTTDRHVLFDIAEQSLDLMIDEALEVLNQIPGAKLDRSGIKTRESGFHKIDTEYKGDVTRLCDAVRVTIIFPADSVELVRAALALNESVCAVKDYIAKPSETGLAIINAKKKLKNGLVGEMQLVTPYMHQAMQVTHGSYKKIDSLTTQFSKEKIPEEVSNEINHLERDCVDTHATGSFLDGLDRYVDKATTKAHGSPALV